MNIRRWFSNKKILLLLLLSLLGFAVLFVPLKSRLLTKKARPSLSEQVSPKTQPPPKSTVLGSNTQAPEIYIYGDDQGYSTGGMIALASTDEPAVVIGGYKITGDAEVTMYEANENALLDYLTHDKEGKQTKKNPDVNQFRYVTSVKQSINTNSYQGSKVPLPFGGKGVWYLKVKIGSINKDAFVLRSNIGVLTKEGDNEFIFWGQNFKTKRSISDGVVKILNLQDTPKELQTSSFNTEGIAKANLNAEADIALVQQNEDRAIIPINLEHLNGFDYSYKKFHPKSRLTRYFIFTDRPLYKPGDTVYFKAVLRDDDDARYTIPNGEALVKIYTYSGDHQDFLLEKTYPISADGTVNGQYQLPATARVGWHTLSVSLPTPESETNSWDSEWSSNTISFNVEFFRKPEFSIDVTTSKNELIAGDQSSFKISGTYFSGQPLFGQKVKYTIYGGDFNEYQYLADQQSFSQTLSDDYRYGWYQNHKITEGTTTLDKNGEAEIDLATKMTFNKGKTQVFSIEATIDDQSQNPSFSRKNILVYAGEYGIYRKDASYGTKVNTPFSLPVTLIPHRNNGKVSGLNLTVKVHLTNWVSFQESDKKYPSYRKQEEDLSDLFARTDGQGNATFNLTPTKTGSYTINVEGKDTRDNLIAKIFYAYVSAEDQPDYSEYGNSDITISTDKQKYLPTDTVRFNIFSPIPDRDVFLSLERGKVNRFQIVRLSGKRGSVDMPLVNTDIPNIFAKVSSFSNSALDSNKTKIIVSSESKKLVVKITPNSQTFGPGETVAVNVATTDISGNPLSAELALWAVDKAIFELSDNRLGDIFKTFWDERYNSTREAHSLEGILVSGGGGGGGCFGAGTKVLMADGKSKNIEDVQAGDYVLTRTEKDAKLVKTPVLKLHKTDVSGYLILNRHLKITANHILRVNNVWQEAGSIQIGDTLIDQQGNPVKITSIEWQAGKFTVYNLEIEKYHTYFAGGVWVHNEKGIERNAFKDTAYWNPSIHTDASGRAQVSFELPDNLTTWTLAAVAATTDTRVGQTTDEIVVTKDVIVRPILPNILRQSDEIFLSALVQNFTQTDQTFDVDLQFEAGMVDQAMRRNVQINANGRQQFYWKVKPTKELEKAKLVFSARAKTNPKLADVVTQEIPVRAFGFEEKRAQTGEGAKTFEVRLVSDSHKEKSKAILSLSPTISGTLPTAMKYLIDYPYGCVEQTTSRFVPAVIAKLNQDLFAEALKDKDINDIIQKGISRLATQQQGGGGWAWWFSGNSNPFITAYVVEYLLQARQAGIKVDDEMLTMAKNYLEWDSYYDSNGQEKTYDRDDVVAKTYALTLLGEKSKIKPITDFNDIAPDLLSLAVMANYLNGDTDAQSNGLAQLVYLAHPQGDAVFWDAGHKVNFGSKDASTALAIRAIVLAGGDRNLAAKGARYLMRMRQSDYWSNTYATAQVIRALVELAKTGEELTPNYTYTVSLDGKPIAQGAVSNPKQTIKEIKIPIAKIKSHGSSLTVTKNGDGQLYSTLLINEFHTDKHAESANQGLSVKREYVNEKGSGYTLGVGDTVVVRITVGGLKTNENYGVINDELPSGLVPINEAFKNEQYGNNKNDYYNSYDVTDTEVTENGIVLSLYQIAFGERTYTYRARVVSEGIFIVPPVTASLMYAPEVYGRSEAQTLKIAKESRFVGKKEVKKIITYAFNQKDTLVAVGLLIMVVIGLLIYKKKRDIS